MGHVNLVAVGNDDEKLKETIFNLVDNLDSAIDEEVFTDPLIEERTKYFRQVGLGIVGYADWLIINGLRYGTMEALGATDILAEKIANFAYERSIMLAKEKGACQAWKDGKLKDVFVKKLKPEIQADYAKYGVRNATVLAIAPTGSTSMLLGVSSGIEPNFAFEYTRNDMLGERTVKLDIVDKAPNKECLVTAYDLTPLEQIATQGVWQYWVDGSISKTINLPENFPMEEVGKIFLTAWDSGCKGITIYRDGSRYGSVLATKEEVKTKEAKLPALLNAKRKKVKVKGENFYFVTSYDEKGKPVELFCITNKSVTTDVTEQILTSFKELLLKQGIEETLVSDLMEKTVVHKNSERIARMVSMALRHCIPVNLIADVLVDRHEHIGSFVYQLGKHVMSLITKETKSDLYCPECGAKLIHREGCLSCVCGFSKC